MTLQKVPSFKIKKLFSLLFVLSSAIFLGANTAAAATTSWTAGGNSHGIISSFTASSDKDVYAIGDTVTITASGNSTDQSFGPNTRGLNAISDFFGGESGGTNRQGIAVDGYDFSNALFKSCGRGTITTSYTDESGALITYTTPEFTTSCTLSYSLPASTAGTYTIWIAGCGGVCEWGSLSITVVAPTATLTASPNPVAPGASSVLRWESRGYDRCSGPLYPLTPATGDSLNGTVSTGPLTTDTTYAFQCYRTVGLSSPVITTTVNVTTCSANKGNACNGPTNSCGQSYSGFYNCNGDCMGGVGYDTYGQTTQDFGTNRLCRNAPTSPRDCAVDYYNFGGANGYDEYDVNWCGYDETEDQYIYYTRRNFCSDRIWGAPPETNCPATPALSVTGPGNRTIALPTTLFSTSYTITNGGTSPTCELLDYSGNFLAYNPCSSGSITWDTKAPSTGGTYGYYFRVTNGTQIVTNYFTVSVTVGCPASGTLSTTYCNGYTQYGTYNNGSCGTYDNIIETNSPSCGYVAAINGGWSGWDLDCATTCGVSKTRTCSNPTPANGGTECRRSDLSYTTPGDRTESIPCPACNTAPNSPSVTGPASGNPDSSYTFTITSTDPEGDQVRYGVDWDKNGVADEWVPAGTATVPSGTALTASHSWSTTGVKQFQVLAQDAPGLNSGWTQKSISLVSQCADTIDNEGDGWADIADPDCHTDGNYSNPTSYDPSRNETGGIASSCNDHVNNNSSALIDCADPVCHTDNNLASACDVTRGEGLHSFTAILRAERNGRVISNKLIPQGSSFDLVWTTTGTPTGCTLKDQRGRNIISNTLNVNYLNRDNVEKIASSRHTVSEGVRENTTFTFSCTVNNAIKATVNVRASTVRAF